MTRRSFHTSRLLGTAALAACVIVLLATSHGAEAAFPGKNGKIAFSRYVAGAPPDIFVAAADGSGLRNLTNTREVGEGIPA